MDRISKPVLIIGVTGRHGGTGRFIVEELLEQGQAVRALVRTRDHRVAELETRGADIVIGDLMDRRSLRPALEGIEAAYFTYPIAAGGIEAAGNFASAAREMNLSRLVVMSMAPARPDSPSPIARAQWVVDELMQAYGLRCIILRIAALFFENLVLLHTRDILDDGVIRNSFPNLPINWISGQDAARLAVAALLHPERFQDQSTVYPSGSANHTHGDVARIVGQHLHRQLRHETVSPQAWANRIAGRASVDTRLSTAMGQHIATVGGSMKNPFPVNDLFERLVGMRSMMLEDALRTGYLSFQRFEEGPAASI